MVNTRNWPLFTLAIFWLMITSTTTQAKAIAQVDRAVVAADETFTLTISIDRISTARSPNIDSLRSNFNILQVYPSIKSSITNSHSEALTQWEITLMPKHVGQMLIPSFTIEGEKTQPISVDVRPAVPVSSDNIQPVYLESEVEKEQVYVQQQLIYVVRLFQSVQLDNVQVHTPEFDNAALKQLSHNIYNRRIRNIRYRVNEWRFAIFPQQSGELTIPESVLSASETVGGNSFFGRLRQGKSIRKMSQQHTITVKEAPNRFKGATWLPAKSLTLVETWSSDPKDIQAGESITRSIQIKAQGLMGSQLPPIGFPAVDGTKLYPDQPQIDNTEDESGVSSSRTDSTALIPTREGSITLPEIKIAWWDTKANTIREAIIEQRTLNVKPATVDPTVSSQTIVDHSQITATATPKVAVTNNDTVIVYWQIACALLALAWFYTLYLWINVKRRVQNDTPATISTNSPAPQTEKQAFKTLAAVCHNNDIHNTRSHVVTWAKTFWPDENINTLQDIQRVCNQATLTNALLQLDNYLYGQRSDSASWNGENLLMAIKLLREDRKKKDNKHHAEQLAPLYPG